VLKPESYDLVIRTFQELDLLADREIGQAPSVFEAFCNLLLEKLAYQPGEKDICILQHKLVVKKDNESYTLRIRLNEEGIPSECSSISRLVGLPAAICAQIMLDEEPPVKGLLYPVDPYYYNKIMPELVNSGVRIESTRI